VTIAHIDMAVKEGVFFQQGQRATRLIGLPPAGRGRRRYE
jgi:hypothetical protein